MTLEEINRKIKKLFPLLKKKYKVKSLAIFGSYLKGEQGRKSDIDILAEFSGVISLFEFIEAENLLSEALGVKVDLVIKDTLKPRVKESILREAVNI